MREPGYYYIRLAGNMTDQWEIAYWLVPDHLDEPRWLRCGFSHGYPDSAVREVGQRVPMP